MYLCIWTYNTWYLYTYIFYSFLQHYTLYCLHSFSTKKRNVLLCFLPLLSRQATKKNTHHQQATWMCRWKLGSMVSKGVISPTYKWDRVITHFRTIDHNFRPGTSIFSEKGCCSQLLCCRSGGACHGEGKMFRQKQRGIQVGSWRLSAGWTVQQSGAKIF